MRPVEPVVGRIAFGLDGQVLPERDEFVRLLDLEMEALREDMLAEYDKRMAAK